MNPGIGATVRSKMFGDEFTVDHIHHDSEGQPILVCSQGDDHNMSFRVFEVDVIANPNPGLPSVREVAEEFSRVLFQWLGADTMKEVVRRNRTLHRHSKVCASHDFCDANMAMYEAFQNLGVVDENSDGFAEDPLNSLWGDAWTLAKRRDFEIEKYLMNSFDK